MAHRLVANVRLVQLREALRHKVMRIYREAGGKDTTPKAEVRRTSSERSKLITYAGTWRRAHHQGYAGDAVAYAKSAGASATFTFSGRKVTWNGPTGPTRGKAKVYVDGKYVKTVNTYRRSFDARSALFRTGWKTSGKHTIKIVVVGTKGHSDGRHRRLRRRQVAPRGRPGRPLSARPCTSISIR